MQTDAEVAASMPIYGRSLLLEHDDWFRLMDWMFERGLLEDRGDPMPHITERGLHVAQHLKQENGK